MHTSIDSVRRLSRSVSVFVSGGAVLFAFCSCTTLAADKYPTYGSLSFFGQSQAIAPCLEPGRTASVRLAIPDSYDYTPINLVAFEATNSFRFAFGVSALSGDNFPTRPALRPLSLEAWHTYPNIASGTWDFISIQKLSNGERLSDAIRWTTAQKAGSCNGINAIDVLEGDLQVSAVGMPFLLPNIRVRASALPDIGSLGASVALASEVIVDESKDTGIDGPKTALLTDQSGVATLAVTPGSRPGIKRFIVKARNSASLNPVSAMVTLAHAPAGAPILNSVPIIEYSYDGGSGAKSRYLTSTTAVTRQLDSHDDSNLFQRTGQVWRAFTSANAAPGLTPVCQFFGRLTSAAIVTHFFTANPQECASLRTLWGDVGSSGAGLKFEGIAFYAVSPDAQQQCPFAFPIKIVRFFEPAPSPHHLYLVIDPLTGASSYRPSSAAISDGVAFCTDVATSL